MGSCSHLISEESFLCRNKERIDAIKLSCLFRVVCLLVETNYSDVLLNLTKGFIMKLDYNDWTLKLREFASSISHMRNHTFA